MCCMTHLQDGQGFVGVTGGDDAVRDLQLGQEPGGVGVTDVGERGPVSIGAQPVSTTGPDIGAGNGESSASGSTK